MLLRPTFARLSDIRYHVRIRAATDGDRKGYKATCKEVPAFAIFAPTEAEVGKLLDFQMRVALSSIIHSHGLLPDPVPTRGYQVWRPDLTIALKLFLYSKVTALRQEARRAWFSESNPARTNPQSKRSRLSMLDPTTYRRGGTERLLLELQHLGYVVEVLDPKLA